MDDRSFAGDQGGDRERRADEQHQVDVESLLGIKAHFFGGPDRGLSRRDHGIGDAEFFQRLRGDE